MQLRNESETLVGSFTELRDLFLSLSHLCNSPLTPPTHLILQGSLPGVTLARKVGVSLSHLFHSSFCLGSIPRAALREKTKTTIRGFLSHSLDFLSVQKSRVSLLRFSHHCLVAMQPGFAFKAMLQDIKIKTGN